MKSPKCKIRRNCEVSVKNFSEKFVTKSNLIKVKQYCAWNYDIFTGLLKRYQEDFFPQHTQIVSSGN